MGPVVVHHLHHRQGQLVSESIMPLGVSLSVVQLESLHADAREDSEQRPIAMVSPRPKTGVDALIMALMAAECGNKSGRARGVNENGCG